MMSRPHTPEETIGLALGFAVVAAAFFAAVRILVELEASFRKSIKAWWRNRRPERGWQPRPRAPFWKPQSRVVGGLLLGLAAYVALVLLVQRLWSLT